MRHFWPFFLLCALRPGVVTADTVVVRILELRKPMDLRLVPDQGPERHVQARGRRLLVDGSPAESVQVGQAGTSVRVRGAGEERRYTGVIEVLRPDPAQPGGGLVLLNRVERKDYVASVAAAETAEVELRPAYAKAMLRVVWAFVLQQGHRHPGYDFCDSTHCQLYHGLTRQARQLRPLLSSEPAPLPGGAPAFFHRCCGGHLDEAGAIWKQAQGTRSWACAVDGQALCATDAKFRWQKAVPFAQVAAAVAERLKLSDPSQVKDLRVQQRSAGGRAQWLEATLGDGSKPRLSAEGFFSTYGRRFGWRHFHSAAVEWEHVGSVLKVKGAGFGHGVGLCQSGAAALAAKGWSADQIIAFYFPPQKP